MAEVLNVNRTQSPNEAKVAIRKCLKINRPIFLWGPPGIGKSDIIHQIGAERNREVIDVRLSLWEPTDIKGIPFYNPNSNSMEWAPPIELPNNPNSTAILFLDELNSAAPATQAAAYQLVLNRRVGSYTLPKGVSIVAAGNRETDKGVTYRMPAPLANRFVHLELKVNIEDWKQWAINNRVHEQVISYVEYQKKDLYDFDPRSSSRAFATPRSWSFVSDLLEGNDLPDSSLTDLVSGAIGDGLAIKFMAHRKIANQLPKAIDVLTGVVTTLKIKEISAMYSLTISLCYELQELHQKKDPNWNDKADLFFRFMLDNFPTEISVMGARVALRQYDLPFDPSSLKNFDEFHEKFSKYIFSAMD